MERDTAIKEWETRESIRGFAMIISEYCGKKINHCLQGNPSVQQTYVKTGYELLCPAYAEEENLCPFYRQKLGICMLKQLPPENWAHHLTFLAERDKELEEYRASNLTPRKKD